MIELPWIDCGEIDFPDVTFALSEPPGLLAAGGDLRPERLIRAYKQGIFPWYEDGQPILWWSPAPRAVVFPEHLHVSRSLAKTIRKRPYDITFNGDFTAVIHACAAPRSYASGTWITDDMINAYCELHRLGIAHSVEAWRDGNLVGGLYGLAIGKIFFGESMFSIADNASKICFTALATQLQQWGCPMIDCQVANPHLTSLGAEEIDRKHFTEILQANVEQAPLSDTWRTPPSLYQQMMQW